MRLIILAKDMDQGLDWLDRFMDTAGTERTNGGGVDDVYAVRTMIISPDRYDRLGSDLDPNSLVWLSGGPTKIIRTNGWVFDQRVLNALHTLNVCHPLCDPSGLLGIQSEQVDARRGWSSDGRTSPMGFKPLRRRGAGLRLPS
jgi:hypothetical protein